MVMVPAAGARADGLPALTCSARTLPVALTDPGPAGQTLWGQLCYRGSQEPAIVQLLVHGVTYNHLYWNFPHGNGYYSYVDAATAAGYEVRKTKVEGSCYEVYGVNKQGKLFELFYDPVDLKLMHTKAK